MDGWTRERPTEAGYYWYLLRDAEGVTEVMYLAEVFRQFIPGGMRAWLLGWPDTMVVSEMNGLWYGPVIITPPAPPQPQQEEEVKE